MLALPEKAKLEGDDGGAYSIAWLMKSLLVLSCPSYYLTYVLFNISLPEECKEVLLLYRLSIHQKHRSGHLWVLDIQPILSPPTSLPPISSLAPPLLILTVIAPYASFFPLLCLCISNPTIGWSGWEKVISVQLEQLVRLADTKTEKAALGSNGQCLPILRHLNKRNIFFLAPALNGTWDIFRWWRSMLPSTQFFLRWRKGGIHFWDTTCQGMQSVIGQQYQTFLPHVNIPGRWGRWVGALYYGNSATSPMPRVGNNA